jgi:BirA family biotin operon repressor/biotin-[acetyl-CoA-carboxylase] ligase
MTTRPPLDQRQIAFGPPWTSITVEEELESTNSAILGRVPGTVLVAEHQLSGRGRLDRAWVAPARAGLTFSVLLRPSAPTSTWGWLPLLAGLALTDAVPGAVLKWPNDLLLGPDRRKVAGILAQGSGDAIVIGIGLNVSTTRAELPLESATSLELEGGSTDRTGLLAAILSALGTRYLAWEEADGVGPAEEYRARCASIGQPVRVHQVGGSVLEGLATGVDETGRLVVSVDGTDQLIAAGDVEHVRSVTQ